MRKNLNILNNLTYKIIAILIATILWFIAKSDLLK